MPHTNTRIYVDTSTDPPTGITHDDIGAVLVRSARDNGQLCGDVRWDDTANAWVRVYATNKAAKFKPVRNVNMWKQQGDWWRGTDGKCGLDITVYNNLKNFIDDLVAGCTTSGAIDYTKSSLPWSYLPPRGMAVSSGADIHGTEPYRSLDFNRYNSDAVFTAPELQTGRQIQVDTSGVINDHNLYKVNSPGSVTYADGHTLAEESLGLNDIKPTGTTASDAPLADYYVGIVFVDKNNPSSWVAATDTDTISDYVSGWVGFTVQNATGITGTVANKEIAMIPFLSDTQISGFTPTSSPESGAFVSAYGIGATQAWIHRFGFVDLAISLGNKGWTGRNTAGSLTGVISIEVASGPIHDFDFTLENVQVGIQVLNNGTWGDVNGGAGFTANSVPMTHGIGEPATGSITLVPSGQSGGYPIYMDDTSPNPFVYNGTYRLKMTVTPSFYNELTPGTPTTVYSPTFTIP